MTKDLLGTLNELGPDYRAVVDRLRAPFEEPARVAPRRLAFGGWPPVTVGTLAAASLAVLLAFVNRDGLSARTRGTRAATYTVAYARDSASLELIVASQRADGSWESDYLTCQNAAALRGAATDGARVAYKKAVRYLRSKGLAPIDDAELRRRGDEAAKWVL